MKLIIVSGRSGSGKSTALHALEDQGFHCIDNLPVRLLPDLVDGLTADAPQLFAVGVDARNVRADLERFPEIFDALRAHGSAVGVEIFYLDAQPGTLVRRFSETRRRHPLAHGDVRLDDALAMEAELLSGIRERADLVLDTTGMTVHALRQQVVARVADPLHSSLSLTFRSFGFKAGVPIDADLVFDVRCLPNPHWVPELRTLTGRDEAVARWLGNEPEVRAMEEDIRGFLERWLPAYEANNRSYITVGIGCTGGRHRSVYLSERLAEHFDSADRTVLVDHREQDEVRRIGAAP